LRPVKGTEPELSWAEEAPEEPAMVGGKLTDMWRVSRNTKV